MSFRTILVAILLFNQSFGQTNTATLRQKINQDLPTNNSKGITAAKLRGVFNKTADALDSVFTTFSLANNIGEYNASTNTIKVTQTGATSTPTTTPAFPDGRVFDIVTAGTQSITGSSTSMAVGGKIIVRGTKWAYIPPSDAAFAFVSGKFVKKNLADPSTFIAGRYMPPNGTPVTNATYTQTARIPVTPGQVISMNTLEDVGFQYGAYYDASVAVMPATGWSNVNTKTTTVPAGAASFIGSFRSAYTSSAQVEVAPAPTAFIPFTSYQTTTIKTPAADVLTDATSRFATDAQLSTIASNSTFVGKFGTINIANPASFIHGRYMPKSGIPVTNAAWAQTGSIPVTPGQTLALNTKEDVGFHYGAFYTAASGIMPSEGWDNTPTKTKVVPAGAAFFIGSFPETYSGAVQVAVSTSSPPIVQYGLPYTNQVSIAPSAIAFDAEMQTVTKAEKARLSTFSAFDDKYKQYETRGWIPKLNLTKSPILGDMKGIADVVLDPTEDFVVECENGSIDTGILGYTNYCSPTPNSHLYPEFCREWNLWAQWVQFMWKKYFPGQAHARFDTPGFFTISGSVTTVATNDDPAWGHQWPDPGVPGSTSGGTNPSGQIFIDRLYQTITPSSGSAAVSYAMPSGYQKAAWILSYSHKSGVYSFSVDAGTNNLLEYWNESTQTWAELNGATLDASTPDEFKTFSFLGSTKIRKDQHSMPFKIRRKPGSSLSTAPVITATMQAGKRIEHWGLYYTRQPNLFIPTCSAKGSHDLSQLSPFHEFGIDKRKPNVFILGLPTRNEFHVLDTAPTDTPAAYAGRFTTFVTDILGKTYIKGVYCRLRGVSQAYQLYDAATDMPQIFNTTSTTNSGYTYINYKNQLVKSLNAMRASYVGKLAVVDLTDAYIEAIERLAADKSITRRLAVYPGIVNVDNESVTVDGTHEGNFGVSVGIRADLLNWVF